MDVPQDDRDAQSVELESGQPLLPLARHLLAQTGYRSLLNVQCQCAQGTIVLSGTVPSYYHKQVAQAVLMANPAIEAVANQIDVVYERERA